MIGFCALSLTLIMRQDLQSTSLYCYYAFVYSALICVNAQQLLMYLFLRHHPGVVLQVAHLFIGFTINFIRTEVKVVLYSNRLLELRTFQWQVFTFQCSFYFFAVYKQKTSDSEDPKRKCKICLVFSLYIQCRYLNSIK